MAGWSVGARLSPAGGVRIVGADLSRPLTPALKAAILAAFRDHHVVVFPDQLLTREAQFAFAANFGEVEASRARGGETKRREVAHVLSNLDRDGNPVARFSPAANYHWHTDKPYYRAPPLLTTLYAVALPPRGGGTEFANTALAHAALPQATKDRIQGLFVVFAPKFDAGAPRVDHPLVRTHPDSGAKALYLGNHAVGIRGIAEAEAALLLGGLLAHATQRHFVYAHRWQKGDLVMWDNRCLLHRGLADFDMTRHARIMHRSLVTGAVPY